MKVFYDHLIFSMQKYGGVSKYFAKLLENISRNEWIVPLLFSDNEYLKEVDLPQKTLPGNFKGKERFSVELGKIYTIISAKTNHFDIYHQTHFDDFLLPFIKKKKMITTFHDTNFSKFPPKGFFWKNIEQKQRIALTRADKIIAISHNTKADLINTFSVDAEKIEVIYHGIDEKLPLTENRIADYPYILYVGTRGTVKNWHNFISAFSILEKQQKELRVICTWHPFTPTEMDFLKSLNLHNKVTNLPANELTMAQLYRDAEMFVFPSNYEGFGMPILEAMLYDCPVVLSNTSCFPEIAQNAGLYFDPQKIDDMAEKMLLIATESELRNQKINLGKERITHFSWKKCAVEHLKVYNSLV